MKTLRSLQREGGFPTIYEVVEILKNLRQRVKLFFLDEDDALEVRLRCHIGEGWEVLHGDPQYDVDHRGNWGAGNVSTHDTVQDLRCIARGMIEDAYSMYAEMESCKEQEEKEESCIRKTK